MICYVCGDDWTEFESDMTPDERRIFLKGNGCPSCIPFYKNPYNVQLRENPLDEKFLNDDDFKQEFEQEFEQDIDIWICDGCDVNIISDGEDSNGDEKLRWSGGRAVHSKAGIVYPYSAFPDRRNPRKKDMACTYCPACHVKFNH
jgi:hypothetical protein